MNKDNKQIQIKIDIKLVGIDLINSSLIDEDYIYDINTTQFKITIEQKIDILNKKLLIAPEIIIQDKNQKKDIGSIKVELLYNITNMDDFFDEEKSQVTFPKKIVSMLNSISLSTVRGIMFSQFKDTNLHNAILPVIPIELISSMSNSVKNKNN